MNRRAAFLVYMPVYHCGFALLFAKYPEVKKLILLRREDLKEFGPTHKDIHGVDTEQMKAMLAGLERFEEIVIMEETVTVERLIIPKDEAVRRWVGKYLPGAKVQEEEVFLRWTSETATAKKKVKSDDKSKDGKKSQEMESWLQRARSEGEKSSDWWRRVGCVLILAEGTVIKSHNQHWPEAATPYLMGDVRAQFHKGEQIELTTAIHAEAAAIAAAAKSGRTTAGAKLVVTDFPCPVCARLISAAGIKEVYYHQGYSMLDGEEILRGTGVKIYQIK